MGACSDVDKNKLKKYYTGLQAGHTASLTL